MEVISAFLDDEPFDAAELAAALADPGGRSLLVDLIALRGIVQVNAETTPAARMTQKPGTWRRLAAVVALPVALAAGYGIGWMSGTRADSTDERAPAPTRVITDLDWQVSNGGN
jgi:hypothetical protein